MLWMGGRVDEWAVNVSDVIVFVCLFESVIKKSLTRCHQWSILFFLVVVVPCKIFANCPGVHPCPMCSCCLFITDEVYEWNVGLYRDYWRSTSGPQRSMKEGV